jgi:cytochrome c5
MAVLLGKNARALIVRLGLAMGLAVGLGAGLTGCGDKAAAPAANANAAAPTAQKIALAPALQPVYQRSCAICHAQPNTGAPLTDDYAAWAPRMAKGREVLLDHVINGFNGMPPLGACQECDEAQYTALIEYMANARMGEK